MERMTKKEQLAGYTINYIGEDNCFDVWSVPKKFMGNAVDRLAAIEDILGNEYDLDRLRKLVEADRDGRCVVIPCNPGDVVWLITDRGTRHVERWIVHRVYKRDTGDWCFDLKNMMLSLKRPNEFEMCNRHISSFGKTVFLTREAAEVALKGEQDG